LTHDAHAAVPAARRRPSSAALPPAGSPRAAFPDRSR